MRRLVDYVSHLARAFFYPSLATFVAAETLVAWITTMTFAMCQAGQVESGRTWYVFSSGKEIAFQHLTEQLNLEFMVRSRNKDR